MCPQSGDADPGLSALVYGVAAPWQVTVLPSWGCQVTDTGVAVTVTLSPGTVAVFDSGTHSGIDPLPGRQVGQLQGVLRGAGADHRARQLQGLAGQHGRVRRRQRGPGGSADRDGGPDRAGQRLHRHLASGRDAAERLVLRDRAPARTSTAPGSGPGRRLAARREPVLAGVPADGPDPAVTVH